MIYLTDHEKQRIFKGVKPMLTEWAGGVKLVETSCYGVRLVRGEPTADRSMTRLSSLLSPFVPPPPCQTHQYHNGSWLREHVDTGDTHIISAIMNIDQDVREDWHLSFIDHNGDRHYIALQVRPALLLVAHSRKRKESTACDRLLTPIHPHGNSPRTWSSTSRPPACTAGPRPSTATSLPTRASASLCIDRFNAPSSQTHPTDRPPPSISPSSHSFVHFKVV